LGEGTPVRDGGNGVLRLAITLARPLRNDCWR